MNNGGLTSGIPANPKNKATSPFAGTHCAWKGSEWREVQGKTEGAVAPN